MSLVLADSITSSECDGSVSDINDDECASFIGDENSEGVNEVQNDPPSSQLSE